MLKVHFRRHYTSVTLRSQTFPNNRIVSLAIVTEIGDNQSIKRPIQSAREKAMNKQDMRNIWKGEFDALSDRDKEIVVRDYALARQKDGCSAYEYRNRIGIGNLQSYADVLAVHHAVA